MTNTNTQAAKHVAGEPAPVVGKWEIIGPDDCPILYRRTLLDVGFAKLLWHRFVAGASDKDCHDHPRSFVTFVLRGGYDDIQPNGIVDEVRAPAVRFRRAEHAHITRVGPRGATTFVVMGPLRRAWGFWREGRWWEWRAYERAFGLGWRCEDTSATTNAERSSPRKPSSVRTGGVTGQGGERKSECLEADRVGRSAGDA